MFTDGNDRQSENLSFNVLKNYSLTKPPRKKSPNNSDRPISNGKRDAVKRKGNKHKRKGKWCIIVNFDATIIPQILLYFIPGYIGLSVYRLMSNINNKSEHTLWISCAISYVIGSMVDMVQIQNFAIKTIASCALSGILAIVVFVILQRTNIRTWLSNVLHFSPAPTVLADTIRMDGNGSTARVYLKGVDYYVEGAVYGFSNNQDDPYFALQYYSFYKLNAPEPYYVCQNDEKCFIVNLNEVQHIEIWPTE